MKASAVLRAAAKVIDTRGFCQGDLYKGDPCTGPVCAWGAIMAVGAPGGDVTKGINHFRAEVALRSFIGAAIPHWSDKSGRTPRQVRYAMTIASRRLERQGL